VIAEPVPGFGVGHALPVGEDLDPGLVHRDMAVERDVHRLRKLLRGEGGNDLVARLVGQRLSERLGQAFVIENRPGAAGNLAPDTVIHARPDGYTLLLVSSNNATNAALYDNLGFDFLRDIAPVAGIGRTPLVMAVNPSVPAKTVPEFIAYAKANPGKVNMGSAGTGGIGHLAGEQFKMMTGVDMTHVPYRGTRIRVDRQAARARNRGRTAHGEAPSATNRRRRERGKQHMHFAAEQPRQRGAVASRRARGTASAHPKARPRPSSTSSTRKSMRFSLSRS
jgi:hypothetical protein